MKLEITIRTENASQNKLVEVDSLEEAQKKLVENRDELAIKFGWGASDYLDGYTGNIYLNNGKIARVSYNGRLWDNYDNEIPASISLKELDKIREQQLEELIKNYNS